MSPLVDLATDGVDGTLLTSAGTPPVPTEAKIAADLADQVSSETVAIIRAAFRSPSLRVASSTTATDTCFGRISTADPDLQKFFDLLMREASDTC